MKRIRKYGSGFSLSAKCNQKIERFHNKTLISRSKIVEIIINSINESQLKKIIKSNI